MNIWPAHLYNIWIYTLAPILFCRGPTANGQPTGVGVAVSFGDLQKAWSFTWLGSAPLGSAIWPVYNIWIYDQPISITHEYTPSPPYFSAAVRPPIVSVSVSSSALWKKIKELFFVGGAIYRKSTSDGNGLTDLDFRDLRKWTYGTCGVMILQFCDIIIWR